MAGNARRARRRRPGDGRLGSAGRRAGRDDRRDRAAAGPDRPAPGRQPGDPRSAGVAWPTPTPARSARASPSTRPSSATPCCWPRTNAGSSPITNSSRATHRMPRSWSRRSGGSSRSPAGRRDGGRRPRVRYRRQRPGPGSAGRQAGRAAAHRHSRQGAAGGGADPAFRRLRNWRVGVEARISHLKRGFGLRRTRLRRLGGARTWVGLGIFAYNLQAYGESPTSPTERPTTTEPSKDHYQFDFFSQYFRAVRSSLTPYGGPHYHSVGAGGALRVAGPTGGDVDRRAGRPRCGRRCCSLGAVGAGPCSGLAAAPWMDRPDRPGRPSGLPGGGRMTVRDMLTAFRCSLGRGAAGLRGRL